MIRWLIINYHYVHYEDGYPFKGLKGNTVGQFRKQVRVLKQEFEVLPAGAVIRQMNKKSNHNFYCTICFDDGISDIYNYVFPILLDEGIQATLFISSSPVFEKKVLSVQKIHLLIGELGIDEFRKRFLNLLRLRQGIYKLNDLAAYGIRHHYRYDSPEIADFKMQLNFLLPYSVRDPILNEVFSSAFGDEAEISSKLYVSSDEIKEMSDKGMEIGSHFHSHSILAFLSDLQQQKEVEDGVGLIRRYNKENLLFSYPFGEKNVWGNATIKALKEYEIKAAFSMGRTVVRMADVKGQKYFLPRFSTSDIFLNKTEKFVASIFN